jgi:hypothetical protein
VIQRDVPRPRSRTATSRAAGPYIRFAEPPDRISESADAVASRISRAHFTHIHVAKATALVADRAIGLAAPNDGIAVPSTVVVDQAGHFAERPARIAPLHVHFAIASHRVKSLTHSFLPLVAGVADFVRHITRTHVDFTVRAPDAAGLDDGIAATHDRVAARIAGVAAGNDGFAGTDKHIVNATGDVARDHDAFAGG